MLEIKGKMFHPYTYAWHPDETRIPKDDNGRVLPVRSGNKGPDVICITTNGFIKNNGECVMGRGCAREASKVWPQLPKALGDHIKTMGNTPMVTEFVGRRENYKVVTFPVKGTKAPCAFDKSNVVKHMQKQMKVGKMVPGWALIADVEIITQSALTLRAMADEMGWSMVILPRPGCGAGELYWQAVGPVLKAILDDRFYAITF